MPQPRRRCVVRLLEGDGALVRVMRFSTTDEVDAGRDDIQAAVRAWCAAKSG